MNSASHATVELNAPFHSWPSMATVHGWTRQSAGRDFTNTIKVNELITRIKRFARTDALVKDFGPIADLLGDETAAQYGYGPISTTIETAMRARTPAS